MATDSVNITDDAEMAEYEGDKVVTMMDVLQEQQEVEEDVYAVLGASDDKNCTYPKGYIKRQAIYACLTCCSDAKSDPTKRAGVCLACSLMCHENHELVELYTKRNFRCDCGNPKFNSHPCQFTPDKPDLNDDNIYNQNFSGVYCICHRPYPDPEAPTEDDMIQCIICEDWLHASHLDTVAPAHDQFVEMICKACMEKNEFLHDYSNLAVNIEPVDVDILTVNGDKPVDAFCNGDVTTEILTNGNVEPNSDTAAEIPNENVDMLEDTEKLDNKVIEEKENNDESVVPNEESKLNIENDNIESTENEHVKVVPNNIDTESQKEQESPSEPIRDSSENSEKSECASTGLEITEENKVILKDDLRSDSVENQKMCNNDKVEGANVEPNTTLSEPTLETKEPEEQPSISDIKNNTDGTTNDDNTNADTNENANKTEDQLMDDIRALTSDDTTDEVPKSPVKETSTLLFSQSATVESKDKNESADSSAQETNDTTEENGNQTEVAVPADPPTDNNTTNSENKADSETTNIEISNTSQHKDVEMETSDDKTDSVMDAIDELLKGPTETNKIDEIQCSDESSANKQSSDNSEIPKANEKELCEDKSDNNVPENTDSKEETNIDVPMTESIAQEKSFENIETSDIEKTESINKGKPEDAISNTENDLAKDVEKSSSEMNIETEMNTETEKDTSTKVINETSSKVEDDDSITAKSSNTENKVSEESVTTNEHKRKLSSEFTEDTSPKKIKLDNRCVRPKGVKKVYKGATFWPADFRQKFCTCGECISMYKDLNVLFLTELEDSVSFYESLGKKSEDSGLSQYEKGLQALSSLDRIQQINALTEYNKMRDKLLDFLKSFKDRKEIVKEEDIKAFFAGMKPRREPDGVYFCK